jgi:membrane protein DedA with SNARE-associated domain
MPLICAKRVLLEHRPQPPWSTSLIIPTDLTSFLALVQQHGNAVYSIVFAYAASHSLLITLFAGFVAHAGALAFTPLVVTCWIGSFLGDVVRFWIGRRYGANLLRRFPKLERAMKVITRLTDNHYLWMILAHRYPQGIRGVAGIAYGMSNLSWGQFLPINLVASGLWSVIVVSIGYSFGQFSEKALNDASSGLGLGMLLSFLALSWYLSRRLERLIEQEPSN